jgi:hypothetical protein
MANETTGPWVPFTDAYFPQDFIRVRQEEGTITLDAWQNSGQTHGMVILDPRTASDLAHELLRLVQETYETESLPEPYSRACSKCRGTRLWHGLKCVYCMGSGWERA